MSTTTLDTKNILVTAALQYFRETVSPAFNYDAIALETRLQNALTLVIPENVGLASYTTDYETILLQLVQALQNDNAWRDIITAGTGQTILRNVSSGLSALHMALIRATQENFSHTAQGENAIMANTRFLGVNPRRRVPNQISVQLTAADYSGVFVIPPRSEFKIASVNYFNRERIVFNEFTLSQAVTLYEGMLYTAELTAEGKRFETVTIGSQNGRISADDVYVTVAGKEWSKRTAPWLTAKNEQSFVERTEYGNVSVRFGDGSYGAVAPANADVEITWAETDGPRTPAIPLGTAVIAPFVADRVTLTGETTSPSFGGDEAVPSSVYKVLGPQMRAADKTAITRANFRAVALDYPNVADAYFQGAAELAPTLRSWMNIYSATVLTRDGTALDEYAWKAFITYLQAHTIDNLEFFRQDPYPIDVDISAKVYFNTEAAVNAGVETIKTDLRAYFAAKLGSLGYSIYASDIASKLEGVENTIDPQISRVIEYADNLVVSYSNPDAPFVGSTTALEGTGLVNGNIICPSTRYYIRLVKLDVTGDYTTRGALSGRRDA